MEMVIFIVFVVGGIWLISNLQEKRAFKKAIGEPTMVILSLIKAGERFSLMSANSIEERCERIILQDKVTNSTTSIARWDWHDVKYQFEGNLSWMNKQEQTLIGEECYEIIRQRYLKYKKKKEEDKKERDATRRKEALEIYK